jgi:glutaminyl-peptide cyclotransferase
MKRRAALAGLAACAGLGAGLVLGCGPAAASAEAPVYGYQVVAAYPHDRGAFTQGLFFHDGWLYESTGQPGRSSIRKVALKTGEVVRRRDLAAPHFGEGLALLKGRLFYLTWISQTGFIYDFETFAPKGQFAYAGQGWGLTTDGAQLIMSDGTATLRFLDPENLTTVRTVEVSDGGAPVPKLNELEWVKGEVWANVWTTDRIVRIDPRTGQVLGWIDLTGLLPDAERRGDEDVLNGVAYDAKGDRLFVTGKQWPKLYEIKLTPPKGR